MGDLRRANPALLTQVWTGNKRIPKGYVLKVDRSSLQRDFVASTHRGHGHCGAMGNLMAATEEAGIALEMLIEIRNKVTDAYRTIINMQS